MSIFPLHHNLNFKSCKKFILSFSSLQPILFQTNTDDCHNISPIFYTSIRVLNKSSHLLRFVKLVIFLGGFATALNDSSFKIHLRLSHESHTVSVISHIRIKHKPYGVCNSHARTVSQFFFSECLAVFHTTSTQFKILAEQKC